MANANGWGDGASNNNIGWGKGADNAIGWGDIHADSWAGLTDIVGAPSTDPDAQAFITAASITDPTQQSAINQLVVDLKGYNVWSKFKAIYPVVGGVASSHAVNLKTPGTFNLTFATGWTHSATGMTPNGATYANTNLIENTSLNSNDSHISIYSRTNDTTGVKCDIGAANSTTQSNIFPNLSGVFYPRVQASNSGTAVSLNTQGLFIANRVNSTQVQGWRNTTKYTISSNSTGKVTVPFWLGDLNNNGVGGVNSTRQLAFASIGDGLSDTDVNNYYTAVQAFQTTLGRSIGTQTVSDADAQAFVTNAGIVDQVEANAVNSLVIGLKADGLWTKMKAVYPFVGGSSTSNSYNLKNTAQYQITWSGGLTHNSQGVTGGGVNGYGNTGLIPSTSLTNNSLNVSVYARTDAQLNETQLGCSTSSFLPIIGLSTWNIASQAVFDGYDFSAHRIVSATLPNGKGFFHGNILSSTNQKFYKNGSSIGSVTTAQTQTQPSVQPIYILARNDSGTAANYSARNLAFASIGDGLTDTEATNFYNRVQTFNTALARQV